MNDVWAEHSLTQMHISFFVYQHLTHNGKDDDGMMGDAKQRNAKLDYIPIHRAMTCSHYILFQVSD